MPFPRFRPYSILCPSAAAFVLLFGRIEADDKPVPAKTRSSEEKEESCWEIRYGKCDGVEPSADVVFVYPAPCIGGIRVGW